MATNRKLKNAMDVLAELDENAEMLIDGSRTVEVAEAIYKNRLVWNATIRNVILEKQRIGDREPLWVMHDLQASKRLLEMLKEDTGAVKPKLSPNFKDEFLK